MSNEADRVLLPLDQLKFGHEAMPPVNARIVGRDEQVPELAASIRAHGLIQALTVVHMDGVWYVADGNRRLAALRLLAEREVIAPDALIKCDPLDSERDADEISLAANFERVPPHEADQLLKFRDLADRGLGEDQIAARFGIEPARVRRMLAIGSLSPMILQAWRDNAFGRDAVGCVRAFTLAKSLEDQERVFARLQADNHLYPHTIRHALGADNTGAKKWLKLVGVDAYVAAGGEVIVDLFGDDHVVSDPVLAERLATEKTTATVEQLKADGWSWVSVAGDLPQSWNYSWDKIKPDQAKPTKEEKKRIRQLELIVDRPGGTADDKGQAAEEDLRELQRQIQARPFNVEQMATSGAVIVITHNGEINITLGVVKPGSAKQPSSSKPEAEKKPSVIKPSVISNALAHRLSAAATLATRQAIQAQPRLGLIALLAGFLTKRSAYDVGQVCPIRVRHEGMGHQGSQGDESFADVFARLRSMTDEDLFRVAAGVAASAVDMQVQTAETKPFDRACGALAEALDAGAMTNALRESFDAVDYFGGVSKGFVLAAIEEAINADEARKAEKLKNPELVEFAVKNVPPTGWLPPELRPSTYTGPGAMASMAEAAE